MTVQWNMTINYFKDWWCYNRERSIVVAMHRKLTHHKSFCILWFVKYLLRDSIETNGGRALVIEATLLPLRENLISTSRFVIYKKRYWGYQVECWTLRTFSTDATQEFKVPTDIIPSAFTLNNITDLLIEFWDLRWCLSVFTCQGGSRWIWLQQDICLENIALNCWVPWTFDSGLAIWIRRSSHWLAG